MNLIKWKENENFIRQKFVRGGGKKPYRNLYNILSRFK